MEMITVAGYRKILDGVWRPAIGHRSFLRVTYSELVNIADSHVWGRKTYNKRSARCVWRSSLALVIILSITIQCRC